MKKKIWIPIVVAVVLLAVLFVPIPMGSYDDGGTREYVALTYKIVDWNRLYNDGTYSATKVYFGADAWKSVDDLFAKEEPNIENVVRATVIEINGTSVLLEPLEGEWERMSGDRIRINVADLEDIGAEVGRSIDNYAERRYLARCRLFLYVHTFFEKICYNVCNEIAFSPSNLCRTHILDLPWIWLDGWREFDV